MGTEGVKRFEWASGRTRDVDPQIVGEAIDRLRAENHGDVDPDALVELARPTDSPLHSLFLWDTAEAAKLYNRQQARDVFSSLRHYYVEVQFKEVPKSAEGPQEVKIQSSGGELQWSSQGEGLQVARRSYIGTGTAKSGPRYTSVERAMNDPDIQDQVLRRERGLLKAISHRLKEFEIAVGVVAAIDQVIAALNHIIVDTDDNTGGKKAQSATN